MDCVNLPSSTVSDREQRAAVTVSVCTAGIPPIEGHAGSCGVDVCFADLRGLPRDGTKTPSSSIIAKRPFAPGTPVLMQDLRIVQIVDGIAIAELLQRHDASRLGKHRNAIDSAPAYFQLPSPGRIEEPGSGGHRRSHTIRPAAPIFGATESGGIVIIRDNRRNQQLRAETEFIRDFICLRIIGVGPIHRFDERHAFERRPVVCAGTATSCINAASTHHGMPDISGNRVFAQNMKACGMQTIDWAESAELAPARLQVLVPVSAHMPADIVAPPSVTDI